MNAHIRWLPITFLLMMVTLSWAGDPADKLVGGWSHFSLGNGQTWIVTREGDKWAIEGYYKSGNKETGKFVGQDIKYADGVLTFVQKLTRKPGDKGPDEVPCLLKWEKEKSRMLLSSGPNAGKLWQILERDKTIVVAKDPKKDPPKDGANDKYLGRWKVTSPSKFEELMTITFQDGKWTVLGSFRKDGVEVGAYHGDSIKVAKDTLDYVQMMDRKPIGDFPDKVHCWFTPTDDKADMKTQLGPKSKPGRKTLIRIAKQDELAMLDKKEKGKEKDPIKPPDKDKKDPNPRTEGGFTEIAVIKGEKSINSPGAAMSPDGKLLAIVGGKPGTLQVVVINFKTKEIVKRMNLESANQVVWSTDGKVLAVLNLGAIPLKGNKARPSQVSVWDCETWEQKALFDHPGFPRHLAISHDGGILAVGNDVVGREEQGVVNIWDVPSKKTMLTLKVKTSIALDLSADGKTLAVSGYGPESGQVGFLDTSSGKARAAATIKVVAERMVLSADGKVAVVANSDKLIVVDAAAQSAKTLPTKGQGGVSTLALVNNNKHVAVGAAADEIRFVALDSGKVDYSLRAAKNVTPLRLQANPDSSLFMTYTTDRIARLWTTPFGKEK